MYKHLLTSCCAIYLHHNRIIISKRRGDVNKVWKEILTRGWRVQGSRFRVQGSGFRLQGFGGGFAAI
jgi:hypothetical protein